ncbi:hypothetical protein [Enterovirga rhinocerotis]|uniref:Uncharacterized protein n=1 Tax=Enterovirga rhinocerotis TaxID=1339210 RepID=A0A4V3DX40_9HYPH|nr:hypothetical protein [Enterovirga rhinocerotis]TDR87199.1 hypothetical protein EV668_4279 [Enterovirga rhinocerotis]
MDKDAAQFAAKTVGPIFLLKLLSLAGSIASTLGFLTFFFFEGLVPYRWWLIGGGTALVLVAELLVRSYAQRRVHAADDDRP